MAQFVNLSHLLLTPITNNIVQYITLHIAPYQQSYASMAAAVNVLWNVQKDPTKHPHYKSHIGSIGFELSWASTIPSPSKIISEDTITTHFHWKKQQHISYQLEKITFPLNLEFFSLKNKDYT